MINHYRTLGVSVDADEMAIRGAYRALIRRYHPDAGGIDADSSRAQAVTAAWETLRDPERRAAYDEARRARFHPDGAVVARPNRGGAAGRNMFLLVVAGTVALGWWASQQPSGIGLGSKQRPAAVRKAREAPHPQPVVPIRPDQPASDVVDLPPLPNLPEEPVAEEMELPPLPDVEPAPLPVPARDQRAAQQRTVAPSPALERPSRAAPSRQAVTSVAEPAIDLAPLERHLQLFMAQSLQFADAGRRDRLAMTGERFRARLNNCATDACKRDTYLRRNQEVAEIMRRD